MNLVVNNQVGPAINKSADQAVYNSNSYNSSEQQENKQVKNQIKIIAGELQSPKIGKDAINKYLILIARLENGLKSSGTKEMQSMLLDLKQRIEQLEEKDIKYLEKTTEYQAIGKSGASLSSSLINSLTDEVTRDKVFALLKSKSFISILKGEPMVNATYGGNNATGNTKPIIANKTWTNYNLLKSGYNLRVV